MEDVHNSAVATHALMSIGSGQTRISTALGFVRAAIQDGATGVVLESLAKLGKSGELSANSERDLYRWLARLGLCC